MIGIVRKTVEHGTVMLRGMHIAPTESRQGIGTQLLRAFERTLDTRDCLCIPYTHLVSFYGLAGFTPLEEATAPAFLQERLANYRARGRSVLVMRRRG